MPRQLALAGAAALTAFAILIALGVWQIERKAWKEGLIDRLNDRLAAPAVNLPPRERWDRLDPAEDEFRRVTFPAEFLHDKEALVYSAGSGLRSDVAGPGYWVFTPARLPGGSIILVNRGFVPEGRQDAKTRENGQLPGLVDIVGVMRWPEPRGLWSPKDDPEHNLWFVRDPLAIAEAKGLRPAAPFYVEQEAPAAPGGLPRTGPIKVSLRNDHLQYALTWFGLAAALAVIFGLWARGRRRHVRTTDA
jgi:surfeit locus 1 family protein